MLAAHPGHKPSQRARRPTSRGSPRATPKRIPPAPGAAAPGTEAEEGLGGTRPPPLRAVHEAPAVGSHCNRLRVTSKAEAGLPTILPRVSPRAGRLYEAPAAGFHRNRLRVAAHRGSNPLTPSHSRRADRPPVVGRATAGTTARGGTGGRAGASGKTPPRVIVLISASTWSARLPLGLRPSCRLASATAATAGGCTSGFGAESDPGRGDPGSPARGGVDKAYH